MTADALCNNILLRSFIWQSTAFVLAGLLASYIQRRNPARAHQALLTAVAAALLAPTFSELARRYGLGLLADSPTAVAAPAAEAYPTDDDITIPQQFFNNCYCTVAAADDYPRDHEFTASGPVSVRPSGIAWRTFLAWVWIVVSAALLFRLVVTFALGLRLLRRSAALGSPRILQAARIAGEKLALNTRIDLRSSADIHSPVIWCWTARPVLLVPTEAPRQNGKADWVSLFCHELAHFKRLDHFTGLVANFIVSLFPWHPLLWWAKQRLAELSEQACDDWVLAAGQSGPEYAESLLGFWPVSQPALLQGLRGPKGDLKMRIHRIVKDTCSNPRIGPRWTLLVCIIGACLAVAVAFAQARPADAKGEERERPSPEAREREGAERDRELPAAREGGEGRETERKHEEPGREDSAEFRERKAQARELEQRANEVERALKGLRDDQDTEARELQAKLREIRAEMDRIRGEFRDIAPEKRLPEGERMLRDADPRARELMQQRSELEQRAKRIELESRELGEGNPKRQELRAEIERIKEQILRIERELRIPREGERGVPEGRELDPGARELIQHRAELQKRTEQLERKMRELGEDHPDRAALRAELQGISEQMRKVDIQLRGPREGREPRDLDPVVRELTGRRLELEKRAQQLERKIRERPDSEDAKQLEVELRQVRKEMTEIQRELLQVQGEFDGPRDIGREPQDIQRQVDQLRGEVNELRGQMAEIRRLLEQLLERQQPRLRPLDAPAERR